MFYRPQDGHGLPQNPFNAIVSPRPIGWIATRGAAGDNLAPYSFFNAVAYDPPQVIFASNGAKDSVTQARESGVFAVSVVSEAMMRAMSDTSAAMARGMDEFAAVGIAKADCVAIDCPRVAEAPATLECKVVQVITLPGPDNFLVIGEVVGVHLREDCLRNGRLDVTAFHPVARLGYRDYTVVREVFEMKRPGEA